MKADLHVHSTASDGTLTPSALVELAVSNGVDVLAIADHDSVEGIESARAAARQARITLIPAVELSATMDGRDVHVLGYFVDHLSPDFRRQLGLLKDARHERAGAMVTALREAGFAINLDDVLRTADGGAVGRSHIARTMVELGHAQSVRHAFVEFLGHGRPYYIAKCARTPEEATSLIHSAGGLAVIAHPGISNVEPQMGSLLACGLDGIEAYHAEHTPEQVLHYAELAASHGLLVTGGTDYHGPQAANPELGSMTIPADAVAELLSRAPAGR